MTWFLEQPAQGKSWGPFETEESAWRFLFGRESTEDERKKMRDANWSVTQTRICWPEGYRP